MDDRRLISRGTVSGFVSAFALCALLLTSFAQDAEARGGPYKKGENVRVEGRVLDDLGKPLPGVTVILAAARLRDDATVRDLFFGDRELGVLEMIGQTDAQGYYRIGWSWDKHHDRFEVLAAAPLQRAGEKRWILFRRDVTELLNGDIPAIADLEVPSSDQLNWLRKFLDDSASDDEMRVYREMGRPDRIDPAQFDYDPDSSWWYFAVGKVYRFRGGALEVIDSFEPVVP